MQKVSKLEFKVGLFVIVAFICLAAFVFSVTDSSVFAKGKTLKVVFSFANGLKKSAPVRIAGVDEGIVKDINLFFIGCGGAAKAVAAHFLKQGVKSIIFANRTVANAAGFADKLARQYPKNKVKFCSLADHDKINEFLDLNPIVVQSTSLGLRENDPSPLAPELFRNGLRVFDMIYHKTNFLRLAEKKKCVYADGRLMLLYQGARSFYSWTGIEPPIEIMKKALFEHSKPCHGTAN